MEDLTYVIAIGIDYDKEGEEYIVHLQAVDFTNVAKQEGGAVPPAPNWIAKAKGKSLNHAVSKLYEKSQPSLFFPHLKVVVLRENAIKYKTKEIMKDLARNRSIRHSLFLFGTKEPMEEIFKLKALFNYPPVYSVLMKPGNVVGDDDIIQPVRLNKFTSRYYEPVGGAVVPSLDIAKKAWKKGNKTYPVLTINGGYFFQDVQYKGFLSLKDISGIKWIEEKKLKETYVLGDPQKPHSILGVVSSKMDVKVKTNREGKPTFKVKASADIEVLEELGDISYSVISKDIKSEIKKEIQKSFEKGLEKDVDVLRLGVPWYRYHQIEYKEFAKTNAPDSYLSKDSLESIEVTVNMSTTNTYKFHVDQDAQWGE